ncbi:MAG: helix-turn-helix domain-containing protein [Pseudomonadota bacterium]
MVESRDKEPDLGRVEDVDDSVRTVEPLNARRVETDPDPDPEFAAASGLTTRDQPVPSDSPEADSEPGASLRRAREAAGLDTATLANRIHLGRGTLEDLEANRFHHMPPAYVRGYFRSCARELGVDAGPWVEHLETHGLLDPELRPVATPSARHQRRRRSRTPYWMAGVLIVALLGLGVYAWSEREGVPYLPTLGLGDGPGDPGVRTPGAETAPEPDAPAAPTVTPPDAMPAEPEVREEPAGADGPGPDSSVRPEALREPVIPPQPEAPPPDGMPEPGRAAEPEPPPEEPAVAPAPLTEPRMAVPEPGAAVVLEISETSWVEIRDAQDSVVFTGVLSPGDREELRVELPGRVVLGNAAGVTLSLEGESIDLAPYIRDDRTARFDLERAP